MTGVMLLSAVMSMILLGVYTLWPAKAIGIVCTIALLAFLPSIPAVFLLSPRWHGRSE